jgi:hypothetical protein
MAYIILFMLYFQLVFNVNANENKELTPEVGLYKLEAKSGRDGEYIQFNRTESSIIMYGNGYDTNRNIVYYRTKPFHIEDTNQLFDFNAQEFDLSYQPFIVNDKIVENNNFHHDVNIITTKDGSIFDLGNDIKYINDVFILWRYSTEDSIPPKLLGRFVKVSSSRKKKP